MMKRTQWWIAAVLLLVTATIAIAQVDVGHIELLTSRLLGPEDDFPGMWEYVYDVYANEASYFATHGLSGFDASQIVNQWEYDPYQYETAPQGTLVQYWSWGAAHATGTDECFGSISNDQINWTLHAEPWSMDNPWHAPTDYVGGLSILKAPMWFTGLVNPDDGMSLEYVARRLTGTPLTGLAQTFRIVHPSPPGTVDWWVGTTNDGTSTGTVVGPATVVLPPGDFDEDGDIDADDIDALGAAIQAGGADPATYDMDGDGDVDADDLAFHVHNLVDTALGETTGTEFGDFNLDGLVGILDLGLLGDSYNTAMGWANGDANGDGNVGILDLGLLGDNYGYDRSAIPEPATAALLLLGVGAILRRRRK
jgi:hypothetical protein